MHTTKPRNARHLGGFTLRSSMTRTWMMAAFVVAAFNMTGIGGKAHAEFIINIGQVGNDVVAVGSGTIDTAGLVILSSLQGPAFIRSDQAYVDLGPPSNTPITEYSGATGPSSFGSSAQFTDASSGSGDRLGIHGGQGIVSVPQGYVSGTALSDTSTFSNQTFSSLELNPGTYTYTFGSGANADSIVINIDTASVPEPSSLILSVVGVVGMTIYMLRRRKAVRA
jgi:hypothetical protein